MRHAAASLSKHLTALSTCIIMHSSLGCARSVYATRGASRQRRLHQRRWQASSRHLSSRRRRTQSDTQLWLSRAPLVHDVGPCSFFDGSLFARNRAWPPLSLSLSSPSLTYYSNRPISSVAGARALGINYEYITNSTLAPAAKSGWCVRAPRRWQALTVREHQTPKWSVFLADATPQLPDSIRAGWERHKLVAQVAYDNWIRLNYDIAVSVCVLLAQYRSNTKLKI